MWYYYGNSVKEALSSKPVDIKSTEVLEEYKNCYYLVIPVDTIDGEEDC